MDLSMDLVGKADDLDMKFRNTTNGYLLPREYVAGDRHVYAEIWGKPSSTDIEMWSEPAHRDADGSDGSPTRQWKRRARSSSTESCTGIPTITWWAHTGNHTAVRRPGGTRRALEPKTDGPRGVAVEAEQHAPRSKGFKVQGELLEAAEDVRDWLEDRRASSAPREMIDGREGRHRWTLMAKIATVAGEA